MNILGSIVVGGLLSACIFILTLAVAALADVCDSTFRKTCIISGIICLALWMGAIIFNIHISTLDEKAYVEQFNAKKATIEQSLESDVLSGAERMQLVNTAVSLNGDLADRKAKFNMGYNVYFDNSIYDNVEPIAL